MPVRCSGVSGKVPSIVVKCTVACAINVIGFIYFPMCFERIWCIYSRITRTFCGLMLGYMGPHKRLARRPDRSDDAVRSAFKGITLAREVRP